MRETLDLQLPDGSHNQLTIFRESAAEDAPLLLLFPAMGVAAAYYSPFAEVLASRGYIVLTADLRGLGKSSVRPSRNNDFGYEEMLQLDYLAIFNEVDRRFPQSAKYILGHSLGGQLASLFLSRHAFDIKGLILLASCSVYYKGWEGKGRWRVWMAISTFPVLVRLLGYFPGDKVGFGGKAARRQLLDWCFQGRTGKYQLRQSEFDYEAALREMNIPILALSIEGDNMAPPRAMQNLYEKFNPETAITVTEITKALTENPKLGHFNWARKPHKTIDLIIDWMTA